MENINKIIELLIAIQSFSKDIHYNCKGDAFYSKHLLVDRIQENISDYIDKIKELFFLADNKEPKASKQYLIEASKLIPDVASDDKESFNRLLGLLLITIKTIELLKDLTKGEENLIGAIAEDLQSSIGLINRQIID